MASVTKAMTIVAGLGCAAAYVSPVAALDPDPSLTGTVYMMLPNFTTVRFVQKDAPAFVAALKKYAPNIKVEVVNGESNPQLQQSQVDAAITGGAKAIVLIAADPSLASGSLNAAKKAGVPLIAYEHEASGGPVTYYTQFGALKVGEAQGKNAAAALSERRPLQNRPALRQQGRFLYASDKRGPGRISEAAGRR